MARAVLIARLRWAAAILALLAPLEAADSAARLNCSRKGVIPASAETEIRNFEQRLRGGALYRELVREFGNPRSCSLEFDGGAIGFSFRFRRNGELSARIDPRIESSEQRVEGPRMKVTEAIAILKAAEKETYRPNGCGIQWDQPEEETSDVPAGLREKVFRGDVCNCQARVRTRGDRAVLLVLRSAC
jgi:hypothetical protein